MFVVLFLAGGALSLFAQTRSGSFTLAAPATTSAGIFASDGRLVRTLWSVKQYPAGTHSFTWDSKDDSGVTLSGDYTAKVIAHNVTYSWDGVVGNTSTNRLGRDKHRSFEAAWGMAFAPDGQGFMAVGYNEQQYPMFRFRQNSFQGRLAIGHDDYQRSFSLVAADGNRAYFANTGSGFNGLNFIMAFNITDANYPEYSFSSGSIESPSTPGQRWMSVIDRGNSVISGLAVQPNGNLLFAAHKNDNVVKVFDKNSGAFLRQFSVTTPEGLACNSAGDLWVICQSGGSGVVVRYTNLGSAPSAATTISGLTMPLAVAVAPDGNVVVADGGSSQQLKAFSNTGTPAWTMGQQGSYITGGPNVANDKFYFRDRTYWRDRAYLSFSPDGKMWVGDVGNERTLVFDANRNFVDHIMWVPHSYSSAADPNAPTRVFNYWQEFEVDYSKPTVEQSWKLVKNWSAGLAKSRFVGFAEGIAHVTTLTDGTTRRTFAFAPDFSVVGPDKFVVFEMPATGIMRDTGIRFPESKALYPDGSIRYREDSGGTQKIWSQPFTGFNAQGNPVWGSPVVIATAPSGGTDPVYRGGFPGTSGPRFPSTQSGLVVYFDQQKKATSYRGWHLGGVQTGTSAWKWRGSPSGRFKKHCDADMTAYPAVHRPCWYQEGDIVEGDGSYDVVDSKTQYGGNRVMAVGKHIVYGYHGEFWNDGQANQWIHYHENGLCIGQFGKPNYPGPNKEEALYGAAGNAFSPTLVEHGGKLYLWHNDESAHAGVHRWTFNGLDQIQEINVSFFGGANQSPSATITSPANGASFVAPAAITLNANATDADGTVVRVEFYNGVTKLGEDTTAPYSFAWNNVAAGNYTITVRAVDNGGAVGTSAAVNFTVATGTVQNQSPTVSISSPSSGSVLGTAPQSTTVTALAVDADGSIAKVEFFQNGVKIGEDTTSPYSFAVSGLGAGSYTFSATATDNVGASASSAGVTVTVNAASTPSGSLSVNLGDLKQEMDGFGAATPGSAMWIRGFQEPWRSEIMRTLFSVTNGIGLSIIRTEITTDNHDATDFGPAGAGTLQPKINSHQPTEGNWYWEGDEAQVWLLQQAKNIYGVNRHFAAVWSPPPWMKHNNDYRANILGPDGKWGRLRYDKYQAYADYLSRYVREYKTRFGIDVYTVSIQNEPDFPAWYQACYWEPHEMVDFLKNYLKPTFQRDGVNTFVMAPEEANWDMHERGSAILNDAGSRAAVDIIANHGYSEKLNTYPAVRGYGKRLWQTEVCNLNGNDNSINDALRWTKNVHGHMTGPETQAYVWWYMTTPVVDGSGGSLLYQTYTAPWYTAKRDTWRYPKRLWAFGNYSRFIRPGYVRVGTTANLASTTYLTAYKDPNSTQIVIVGINDSDTAQNFTVNLAGGTGVTSMTPYFTSKSHDLERQADVGVSGGSFTASMPARSIVTWVRNPSPLPAAPTGNSFVSDLEWVSSSTGGIDPVQRDRTAVGSVWYGDPINLKGTSHAKGLGFTPPATVIYNLDGKCANFAATVGLTKGNNNDHATRFQVYGDDQLLFDSGAVKPGDAARDVNVDVAGRKLLKLVAVQAGNGNNPTDNQSVWASARVTYVGGPSVSFTSPASQSYFPAGSSLTLQATASTAAGASISRVEFYNGATKIGEDTTSPYSLVWSAPNGTNTVTAKAVDSTGATVTSAAMTYFVGVNQQPTVALTAPSSGASYTAPVNLSLTASASDPDGSVAKVEFYNGATKLGEALAAPFSFIWNSVPAGSYSLTARVTDNQGATATSTAVTVTVNPPANQLPTVALTAPTNNAQFLTVPANIALTATASDADGSIAKVEFYTGGIKLGEDTTAPYTYSWNNVAAGVYTVMARAIDNLGGSKDSAISTIRVGEGGIPVFWRGINFGGPAVTINGNAWLAQNAASSSGLSLSPSPFTSTTTLTPTPTADSTMSTMLNSCVWSQNGFTVNQTASNGTYQVYFYVMENYLNNFRNISFRLEGQNVASSVGVNWTVGQWQRYGPFEVTVLDGALSLELVKVSWDPCLMGMEIYSVVSGGGSTPTNQLPTVALTAPAAGSGFTAPASVTLAASASDSDGSVAKVEFFSGATKLGEDTTSPYTFLWNNVAAGSYSLTAVATDDKGATKQSGVVGISVTNPPASALNVTVTSPTNGASYKLGDAVTLSASVTENLSSLVGGAASKDGTSSSAVAGGLTINVANYLQEIDGFGIANIAMAGIHRNYPEPMRSQITDMLFNTNNGAGFSILRSEIISDDHDQTDALWSWAVPGINTIQPARGVWNWDGDVGQVWLMQEAKKRGVSTFLSTVWSPPEWMKDNNDYRRGHLKRESYTEFAEYLSRYVREYQTRFGIPITHISPANEPNYAASYQSCDWTPEQMRDLLRDHIGPVFARDGITAKTVMAEVNNWSGTMGHVNATLDDANAARYLDIVAGHGYEATPQYDYHTRAFEAGKKVWMTEDCDLLASSAVLDSDWAARNWFKMIHGYLTKARVSAWVHWYGYNFAWGGAGLIYGSAGRNGSASSAYPAGRAFDYRAVKALHTISHVSRFVRPGYRLLNTSFSPATGIYTLVFVNPANGQVVIVALNDTNSDYVLSGSITGSALTSLKPYVTDTKGARNLAPLPRIAVTGGDFSYTIPANGMVTLVRDEVQPAPPTANAKVYLTDLNWSSCGSGWIGTTPVEHDRSNGGDYYGDGSTLSVKGTTYTKGLGTAGAAHISYFLGGRAQKFSAVIGVDDSSSSFNSVAFQVWADGTKLYDSGSFNKNGAANGTRINVDVTGKQELTLVITGENKADWADAYLETGVFDAPPVVAITSPANNSQYASPASFTLTATASDSDGSVARVDFLRNGTVVGNDTTAPYTFAVSGLTVGSYTYSAIAYDAKGNASEPSVVTVTVVDPNQPVLVEFYVDGAKVGEDSTAPYSITWNGAVAGVRTITAKATKTQTKETGVSAPVSITVEQPADILPEVTLTSPFNGASFAGPANITLSADASDSDGTVVRVEFYNGTTKLGEDTTAPYSFAWNNVPAGTYSLSARAVDDRGGIGNSVAATISVLPPPNQTPVVALTAPANSTVFPQAPANVPLTATASDSDGSIVKVEFFAGSTKVGESLTAPYTYNWLNAPAGTHILTAKATDNVGGVTTSAALTIQVGSPGTPVFWRGVNFGGPAITIAGNSWLSQTAAESQGLSFNPRPYFATTYITPVPSALDQTNVLLNSCAWFPQTFTVNQTVTNGTYQVCFWAMENYQANFRDMTVKIEGNSVASSVGKGWTVGQWSKYGPYEVTVTDGSLTLEMSKVAWDPCLMGMEISRVVTASNQPPTVAITSPANGATVYGSQLTVTANATDADGTVAKVEFFRDDVKLGEVTNAPFQVTVAAPAAGTYVLSAIARDNAGAVKVADPVVVSVVKPTLASWQRLANGTFQIGLPAIAGLTNTVEASTNLSNWVVLTNLVNPGTATLFSDAAASGFKQRFYRVKINGAVAANVVGFVNVTAVPGYNMVANPLIPSTNRVGDIFRGLPSGTTISKFRPSRNDFAVNSYDGLYNIWDDPSQTFGNGEAAFLLNPASTNLTISFVGEVAQGLSSRPMPSGYSMVGSLWPQGGLLETELGYAPSLGDVVYLFRNGEYDVRQAFGNGQWDSEPSINVGEGFFVYRFTQGAWTRNFSIGD